MPTRTTPARYAVVGAAIALVALMTALFPTPARGATAPQPTSLTPYAGPLSGGTLVTINGSGFTGTSAVTVGGAPASYTVASDTQITLTAPASASPGLAPVQITNLQGTAYIGYHYFYPTGTTFLVNSSADTWNDANCQPAPGTCTLRQAFNASNTHVNEDGSANAINFGISVPETGPIVIQLDPAKSWGQVALGWANTPVVINGITQRGAVCDETTRNIRIQINPGSGLGPDIGGVGLSHGLGDGSVVRGVAIGGFTGPGINIHSSNSRIECSNLGMDADGSTTHGNGGPGVDIQDGTGNIIGGGGAGHRNIISGNGGPGVRVSTANNTISGNYIGIDVTGSLARPNANGIGVGNSHGAATGNVIGGTSPDQRNIISGNTGGGAPVGVLLWNGSNRVVGNYIGTDVSGLHPIPNGQGIRIESAADNVIGGIETGQGNVISGNNAAGVVLANPSNSVSPARDTVAGNLIGVGADGASALPNARGVNLLSGTANQVVNNTIAHNHGGSGLNVGSGAAGNSVSQNVLFDNGPYDVQDPTLGTGTAGTANTYIKNLCQLATPPSLCQATSVAAVTATTEASVTTSAGTPSTGTVTATTDGGAGTVAVATYNADPGPTPSFSSAGGYFDVYVTPGSTFTGATVTFYDPAGGTVLYWFDGIAWLPVPNVSVAYPPAGGTCLSFVVTPTSTPGLADLGGTVFATATNPPVLGTITATPVPAAIGAPVSLSASFTDSDIADTHTATVEWGDGTLALARVAESSGIGAATATHAYAAAGVYTVTVTVTDNHGAGDTETFQYVVVYDPSSAGHGSGWFTSPAGAAASKPTATGKAEFGFELKYKKDGVTLDGSFEFHFELAGIEFHSTSTDWLVVSGSSITLSGQGRLKDASGYAFQVWAATGGKGVGAVRVRIWNTSTGVVIYDSQPTSQLTDPPTILIGGGTISTKR